MLEAKAKDQGHKAQVLSKKKKKVFTKIFQAISKKKKKKKKKGLHKTRNLTLISTTENTYVVALLSTFCGQPI